MSGKPTRRGGGRLSAEDLALWHRVARELTPLPGRKLPERERGTPSVSGQERPRDEGKPKAQRVSAPANPVSRSERHPPLMPIDRRTRQRIVRGRMAIDDRIDLHGMTQARAHLLLCGFLRDAQRRGCRVVLVVTGKGRALAIHSPQEGGQRGVLRRVVPKWLRLPELRDVVLSVGEAHAVHGGEGALYVRLRRRERGAK